MIHTAPYRHCDESGLPGSCTPTTKDISIGFFKVPKSFTEMKNTLQSPDLFGDLVKPIVIAGRDGVMFESGAEGEGAFFYFLPLDVSDTLVIARTYINEEALILYENASGFIAYADQERLFNEIIKTLEFQDE